MIRGKYLRERKAIRTKRRIKIILAIAVLLCLYKIIFSSYSVYESNASSTGIINIAYYVLADTYQTRNISLASIEPGSTTECVFSISNYKEEDGEQVMADTDLEYSVKLKTTTNLPLEYKLYKNQSDTVTNPTNLLDTVSNTIVSDDDDTLFKNLVLSNAPDEYKENGITDYGEFIHNTPTTNTYRLEVTLPEIYDSIDYSNRIEAIEVSVEAKQIID